MDRLRDCLEDSHGPGCEGVADELAEVGAYHELLRSLVLSDGKEDVTAWSKATASSLLVALHNMVTASINSSWQGSRRRFYCVGDVLGALPSSLVGEVKKPWPPLRAQGVPGLPGNTDRVQCP